MSSSSASGQQQVSFDRRRYQNRPLGRGRSVSFLDSSPESMSNHKEDLPKPKVPRSLSDIWELEAKLAAAGNIAQNTGGQKSTVEGLGVSVASPTKFDSSSVEDDLEAPDSSEREPISESGEDDHEGIGVVDTDEDVKSIEMKPGRADRVPNTYFDQSEISLPPSAASYYSPGNGHGASLRDLSPETCESLGRLNQYLHARKMELKSGVPGKFLHAVIGQEAGGSAVSTIVYAFYLDETQKSSNLCTLPVINMKRADLNVHSELKWLLSSCHVDLSSLVFIDEIDLSYHDLFGSLKLVLLNGHNLPSKQEGLRDAVVEVFNCKQDEVEFSRAESVTVAEGCSSCALVAEKFAETSPETLAGCGFSRLLLAGILLDTANLGSVQCTLKDKYMATLLLKGAGRFGRNGLYQILKDKMFDISDLKVWDVLRRDLKKWTGVAGKLGRSGSIRTVPMIGMSTIGISIEQLLAHEGSDAQEITLFLGSEKLHLLLIVSGYYDRWKTFKREMLVAADTSELMRGFLHFFNANGKDLPLKPLQLDLGEELSAFEIDNGTTSRRTIERLLEEFSSTLSHTWRMHATT